MHSIHAIFYNYIYSQIIVINKLKGNKLINND
jgi:hypothetical protein